MNGQENENYRDHIWVIQLYRDYRDYIGLCRDYRVCIGVVGRMEKWKLLRGRARSFGIWARSSLLQRGLTPKILSAQTIGGPEVLNTLQSNCFEQAGLRAGRVV